MGDDEVIHPGRIVIKSASCNVEDAPDLDGDLVLSFVLDSFVVTLDVRVSWMRVVCACVRLSLAWGQLCFWHCTSVPSIRANQDIENVSVFHRR